MARVDLKGKPIVIAGASSGIGWETALWCARAGMPVALGARRLDKISELAERIQSSGGKAIAVQTDVTEKDQCCALIDQTLKAFGSIHAVYANAGYGQEMRFLDMTDEQIRAIFETNFFGTINTIRPALIPMKKQGSGHVLICSSCLARFPMPLFGAYSASKAAQHHLGRAMDLELRSTGISISTVMPIATRTEFFDVSASISGGGMSQHVPQEFMQPAHRVSKAIVRCLKKPKPEVWTSWPVRLGMIFSAATPRLANMGVKHMVKAYDKLHPNEPS